MELMEYLINLADNFDKSNFIKCADAVDSLISSGSLTKVAQYVGVIGYVLKQERAMMNCIRRKRAARSDQPMQEVIFDCLKEYNDSQKFYENEWTSKYAEILKTNPSLIKTAHIDFINLVGQTNNISEHIQNVVKTAATLKEFGHIDQQINSVLNNLNEITSLLEGNQSPFELQGLNKLADERGSWSQFFNPSQKKWYNPFSWSEKNLQKGRFSDIGYTYGRIIGALSTIAGNTSKINYELQQLKSTVKDDFIANLSTIDTDSFIRDLNNLNKTTSDPGIGKKLNNMLGLVNQCKEMINLIMDSVPELGKKDVAFQQSVVQQKIIDFQNACNALYGNILNTDLQNEARSKGAILGQVVQLAENPELARNMLSEKESPSAGKQPVQQQQIPNQSQKVAPQWDKIFSEAAQRSGGDINKFIENAMFLAGDKLPPDFAQKIIQYSRTLGKKNP